MSPRRPRPASRPPSPTSGVSPRVCQPPSPAGSGAPRVFQPPSPSDAGAPDLPDAPYRGVLVPGEGSFPIASRHDRVINLLAEDARGGYFVSLIIDPEDWTELAVLLRGDQWKAVVTRPVGDRVAVADFGARATPCGDRSSTVLTAAPSTPTPPTAAVVAACRSALLRHHGTLGFVPLLSERPGGDPFLKRAAAVVAGVGRWVPGATPGLTGLIGLGPGFTPAGDDFLSGVLLAEILLSGGLPGLSTLAAIEERLAATTPGGAALLRLALAGVPPRYQCRVVTALGTEDVDGAITIAARHGHSSGFDFLAGLIWALEAQRGPEGHAPSVAV
jgi:hypothetical protein